MTTSGSTPRRHLPHILEAIERIRPELVVIDSIQTVVRPESRIVAGLASGRSVAAPNASCNEAKERDVSIVLVGHVTKEGGLAGPRVLEHVVDTVLQFEGDRHHALRLLRASKHRFGPTNELGLFEMATAGLLAVPDRVLAVPLRSAVPGCPSWRWCRPWRANADRPVEVQALANPGVPGVPPRRTRSDSRAPDSRC